jgi:hypothetical protein
LDRHAKHDVRKPLMVAAKFSKIPRSQLFRMKLTSQNAETKNTGRRAADCGSREEGQEHDEAVKERRAQFSVEGRSDRSTSSPSSSTSAWCGEGYQQASFWRGLIAMSFRENELAASGSRSLP